MLLPRGTYLMTYYREIQIKKKIPALSRIQTRDLLITRRALYPVCPFSRLGGRSSDDRPMLRRNFFLMINILSLFLESVWLKIAKTAIIILFSKKAHFQFDWMPTIWKMFRLLVCLSSATSPICDFIFCMHAFFFTFPQTAWLGSFFLPPMQRAGIELVSVSSVAPPCGTLMQDSLLTELHRLQQGYAS